MTTHFHLIIQLRDVNLGAGMHKLNGGYDPAFNARHGLRGPVFEARYSDTPVSWEGHLKAAIRYVAMNPVEAGIVERPEDWPWSTYPQLLGKTAPWPCFKPADVLELFGSARAARLFVEDPTVPGTFGARHLVRR